ncbi:hypothetical protein LTR62_006924 [Meristemomyces frigidus]|uniref:Outer spore wall protein RRT8 n=1 Tax=Meristemomyces frigidus TaxID=1508187 RepID=A0AAN7YIA2_9PEZI|nr:hypothetical protein LTR62_006924 [Meristemomyces frigidus]
MSASTKIKDTAMQEATKLRQVAEEGAKSGAYIYPLRGIVFFATHKDLYKPLFQRLTPTIGLGVGITALMFFFTYVPQLAVLFFTSGPLAALTTILLVLSESSTLTMVLSKALLIQDGLIDTFDGTLLAKGQADLVARDRQVKSGGAGFAIARLGKLASRPFQKFTPTAIIRYFMYLPLNFIPVVGTVAFVVLQGRQYGPNAHARYFQLKGMNAAQKEKFIEEHKGGYASFGVVATLLETVPIVGIVMAYTNACGAAMWAADLEQGAGTAPQLQQQAKKAA